MRISVTGDADLVDALGAAMVADDVGIERPDGHRDRTEQKFGLVEVGTVVAILTGIAKLIEYLVTVAKAMPAGRRQTLKVKTALGVVSVELAADVSAAELQRQLAALEATR